MGNTKQQQQGGSTPTVSGADAGALPAMARELGEDAPRPATRADADEVFRGLKRRVSGPADESQQEAIHGSPGVSTGAGVCRAAARAQRGAVMARVKTRGGSKLRAWLTKTRANASRLPVIEVGFLDRQMSVLASRLEFGDSSTNLPERPAFRQGVEELRRRLPEIWRDVLGSGDVARDGIGVTHAQAVEVGLRARDVLRASYEAFEGPGLSERQAKCKEGTKGAGRELVGHEGPKLIGHLEVRVDGVTV